MRSKNLKKKALTKALKLAKIDADVGLNVMVLLPSVAWVGDIPLTYERLDAVGARHIQFSNSHAGLKAVIDTLILVGPGDPAWDYKGEELTHKLLRTSTSPQGIKFGEGAKWEKCFFCGEALNCATSETFRNVLVHSHIERCCLECFPKHKERWIA